jgi:hypothetical protein
MMLQELALKLRAEGRSYSNETFNRKKRIAAFKGDGAGRPKKKIKVKSSQRNKAPYNVSSLLMSACIRVQGQAIVERLPSFQAATAVCRQWCLG